MKPSFLDTQTESNSSVKKDSEADRLAATAPFVHVLDSHQIEIEEE
jgi:hypothetical protein